VLELNPVDIEGWLDYSSILFEQEKLDEAIEVISDGIKNNPDSAELYYRMVAYLFAAHQIEEALVYLETALNSDPEKHHILFEYLPQLHENKVIIDIINRYTR
jgi:tetratricopeptide (TPR) repeat protein